MWLTFEPHCFFVFPPKSQFRYSTNLENSKGKSKSIMFTVTNIGNRSVIIEEFDVINRKNEETVITIFSLEGSLEELGDSALNFMSWGNPIYQSVKLGQMFKLLELNDFDASIKVVPGASVSFYIHSTVGVMYRKLDDGFNPDEKIEGDAYINISEGKVMRNLFRNHIRPGLWGGAINYRIE